MTQRGFCQVWSTLRVALLVQLIIPAGLVVAAAAFVEAGEQPVLEAEAVLHDEAGVGVGPHVLVLDRVLLQQAADQAAQERDIGSGPDRRVEIGNRRGAREARIDDDQLGAVLDLRLDHPFEAARVRFGGIATHDDNHVGILDVLPGVRHRTATECWGQTGHRRSVSDAGLVIEDHHAEGAGNLPGQERRFGRRRRRRQHAGAGPAVDRGSGGVFRDEILVAILLHQRGDAVEREIPADLLEFAAAGGAVFRHLQPGRRDARYRAARRLSGKACRGSPGGPDRPRCG